MRNFFTLRFHVKTNQPVNGKNNKTSLDENSMNYIAPDRCVETIMSFARSYRVAESASTGKVEMILN